MKLGKLHLLQGCLQSVLLIVKSDTINWIMCTLHLIFRSWKWTIFELTALGLTFWWQMFKRLARWHLLEHKYVTWHMIFYSIKFGFDQLYRMVYLIWTSIVNKNFSLSQNIKLFILGKSTKKFHALAFRSKQNRTWSIKWVFLYCKDLLTKSLFVKQI